MVSLFSWRNLRSSGTRLVHALLLTTVRWGMQTSAAYTAAPTALSTLIQSQAVTTYTLSSRMLSSVTASASSSISISTVSSTTVSSGSGVNINSANNTSSVVVSSFSTSSASGTFTNSLTSSNASYESSNPANSVNSSNASSGNSNPVNLVNSTTANTGSGNATNSANSIVASSASSSSTASAADTGSAQSGLSCPSAELLSARLLTDICWECMLPIRIAGAAIGGGKSDYPEGAVDDAVCSCRDKGDILPRIGYTLGFWQPIRLIELVRTRGCLLSLNGTQTSVGTASHLGTRGTGEIGVDNMAFYHYHYYAFPLLQILGLLNKDICFNQEYLSLDMLYASEIDPTWNYPEIASLVFPETRLFATPQAVLGCAADTLAHGAQRTSKGMFWCAGSWGTVYPVSGYDHGIGSGARITSLLATRALTASHRRGFEPQTVGKGALCSTSTETTFNADQYRFTMLYPIAEDGKHPVGASTFTWGEATNTSDAVYMVWRWRDCCSSFGLP